jgi:hypothetical protein
MRSLNVPIRQLALRIKTVEFYQLTDLLGLIGLSLFIFGIFYRVATALCGFSLMVFAFGFNIRHLYRPLIKDPILILNLVFIAFLFLQSFMLSIDLHDFKSTLLNQKIQSIQLAFGLILFTAYWMHRFATCWNSFIIILMAGFLIRILFRVDWNNFSDLTNQLWDGTVRASFGSSTPNRFGEWCSVILLASLVLPRKILNLFTNKILSAINFLFWATALSVSALGLILSQSRGAWMAAAFVIPPIIIFKISKLSRRLALVSVCLLAFTALFIYSSDLSRIIEHRIKEGVDSFSSNYDMAVTSDDFEVSATPDSINHRILLYKLFFEKWIERPWTGHGAGASRQLIGNATAAPYSAINVYNNFHNQYFEILIQFGIIGLFLNLLFVFFMIFNIYHAKRRGYIDIDYFLFAIGTVAIFLICSMFGQSLASYKTINLAGFIFGICYSSKFKSIENYGR